MATPPTHELFAWACLEVIGDVLPADGGNVTGLRPLNLDQWRFRDQYDRQTVPSSRLAPPPRSPPARGVQRSAAATPTLAHLLTLTQMGGKACGSPQGGLGQLVFGALRPWLSRKVQGQLAAAPTVPAGEPPPATQPKARPTPFRRAPVLSRALTRPSCAVL